MSRRKKHGRSWPEDDSKATKKFHGKLAIISFINASINMHACRPLQIL